jgi:O-antigen/teichoic acid export membrane protein
MNIFVNVGRTLRQWFGEGVFRRIFKNAGLMLSGRAATGLLSLGTLSVSARSLGVEQFGILVLVQTYAQVIASLSTFQSPQAVIRYGATTLENNDTPGFQSLLKFVTGLDFIGGVVAVIVGFLAAPIVGPHLGWNDDVIRYAQFYSFLVFFTACATPTGILRLFDRFDVLAMQTTVTPLLRLVGVSIAALLDAPLWGYLLAWFFAQVVGGASLTYLAWRESYKRGRLKGIDAAFKNLAARHDGIWSFLIQSNLYSSILIVANQLSIILIGNLASPAAAGIYKIGRDASTVLSKPAELLNQSVYPEFARFGSKGAWEEFGRLIRRGAAIAAGAGAFMLTLAVLFGAPFLQLAFGADFGAAYVPLVLLVAAACLTIVGFPMDAALFAMGRASIPLRIGITVVFLVQLPLLWLLTKNFGADGAGFAMLAASAATVTAMTFFTWRTLRRNTTVLVPA